VSDLTRAQYVERVLSALGNLDATAHPLLVLGVHLTAIDNAPNRLIRQNPDLFPDHQNRSWTIGPTVVGANRIAIPRELLIINKLRRTDDVAIATTGDSNAGSFTLTGIADTSEFAAGDFVSTSAGLGIYSGARYRRILGITATTITMDGPASAIAIGTSIYVDPGDWSATQELPVSQSRVEAIGLMSKVSDDSSFPQLFDRKDGGDIVYWPTTNVDTVCWFRAWGVSGEAALSSDDDQFRLDRYWDSALVLMAASETAEMLGWAEKAAELLAMANQRIQGTINPLARERAQRSIVLRPAGMPR
jgi:hypothetical protein